MNAAQLKSQVENLVRYILANPSENLSIYSHEITNGAGDVIARFNNHLQAVTAVRTVRESLQVAA